MWLPAFKYIKGLLAQRGSFVMPDGEPYEGSYHKLYNGKTFTGDIPNKDAIRIYADDSEPHLPEASYEDLLVSEPVHPTPEDYDKGFFMRYFIKDHRNAKIVEVKHNTYGKKIEEKFLSGIDLKWIIDKPIKDIFNQGYLFKGTITRNKENTLKASLILKGLDGFIQEYDKFADIQSDVEGFKFEELPRTEKIRIIRKISNIQNKTKVKSVPRFKNKFKKIKNPQDRIQPKTTPSSGGGGGSVKQRLQYLDEVDNSSNNSGTGGGNETNVY